LDQAIPTAIDGWDEEGIAQIDRNADVLIRGAGLSSIDATIRLLEQGHTGNIVWYSRSGELPYVRPRQLPPLIPKYLDYLFLVDLIRKLEQKKKTLTLAMLVALFKAEVEAQKLEAQKSRIIVINSDYAAFKRLYDRACNSLDGLELLEHGISDADNISLWFSVAKLLDEYLIPLIWNAMSEEDQVLFLDGHRRVFDRLWAPIPKQNGILLLKWIREGTIRILRGASGDGLEVHPITGKMRMRKAEDALGQLSRSELERYEYGFDVVIEAMGICSDLEKLDSELVGNMVDRGLLVPNLLPSAVGQGDRRPKSLGAKIDWYTGAVLNASKEPYGWLFSLTGSLTSGAHRFTNSYLAVSASAHRVATEIFRHYSE
jgi:uncharacterized NAD(P)/FAD-binding protein YdhS